MPTKTELLCKAKELGLRGYTGFNKAKLEEFVEANTPRAPVVLAKRPKKKTTPPPAPPSKPIKVRKPKSVMTPVDEAQKYLEELEKQKIIKGVAKLQKTVSKGIVKSALERAVVKYKAKKAESKGKAEALLKKAMAKYMAKKTKSAVPSVAEQVMFNPDLLKSIADYNKTPGSSVGILVKRITDLTDNIEFGDNSDDGNEYPSGTFTTELLEDLNNKINPAVSETIGFFYIYGGDGNYGGVFVDVFDKVIAELKLPFKMETISVNDSKPYDYFRDYIDAVSEQQEISKKRATKMVEDEDPSYYKVKITYTTDQQRLQAIDVVKAIEIVMEQKYAEVRD
jgi:hypothetical protein